MQNKTITFSDGDTMPALCMGTWYLGEKTSRFYKEVDLLKNAVEEGVTAFDLSEMYGNGGAEEVAGEAFKDCRKSVFLCSKVIPENASYDGVFKACERTLDRLRTDYLDMYSLHWYSDSVDLSETLEALSELKRQGLIKRFGVSNFDCEEIKNWMSLPYGNETDGNQVLYNLFHRANKDIVRSCQKKKVPVMGYFPYESKDMIFNNGVLKEISDWYGATPYQISLAWMCMQENTGILLKAKSKKDLKKAVSGIQIPLNKKEIFLLDETFPVKR